jgi:hypothetical protein
MKDDARGAKSDAEERGKTREGVRIQNLLLPITITTTAATSASTTIAIFNDGEGGDLFGIFAIFRRVGAAVQLVM